MAANTTGLANLHKDCCNTCLEINVSKPLVRVEFSDRRFAVRIGYARVSTADQNPDLQEDALQKAGGCGRSGAVRLAYKNPGTVLPGLGRRMQQ